MRKLRLRVGGVNNSCQPRDSVSHLRLDSGFVWKYTKQDITSKADWYFQDPLVFYLSRTENDVHMRSTGSGLGDDSVSIKLLWRCKNLSLDPLYPHRNQMHVVVCRCL